LTRRAETPMQAYMDGLDAAEYFRLNRWAMERKELRTSVVVEESAHVSWEPSTSHSVPVRCVSFFSLVDMHLLCSEIAFRPDPSPQRVCYGHAVNLT